MPFADVKADFVFPSWTFFKLLKWIKMISIYLNYHMMTSKCHEKRDLVHQIKKMNSKVIASSHVKGLCYQIGKLTKNLNDVMTTNEKIASKLLIVKNVNSNLENCITALEKI